MKTTTLVLVAGLGLLCACSDNRGAETPDLSGVIRFESGIQTKAGPVTGTQFAAGTKVGVYTLENRNGVPVWTTSVSDASNNLIMNNVEAEVSGSGGLVYEPVKMYTANANYSFFAYYPYEASVTDPSAGQPPKLACTFGKTPSDQIDYMYASPLENKKPVTSAYLLSFNHALTQVTVKVVNGTGDKLTLHSLKIQAPGGATLNIGNGTWSAPSGSETYILFGPSAAEEIQPKASFSVPGQLMLLPVAAKGTAYTFDMGVTEGDASSAIEKTGQTLTLPTEGLRAGYSYEYTVTYGSASSIQLSTSVVEWQYVSGPGITVK